MYTITEEMGVLLLPSDSCSLSYGHTDDVMDIVQ